MSTNITVSREYLLSLFRRLAVAESRFDDQSISDASHPEKNQPPAELTIAISTNEYTELKAAAHEYQTLTKALLAAGTSLESIKVLAQSSQPLASPKDKDPIVDTTCAQESSPPLSQRRESSKGSNRKYSTLSSGLHKRFYAQNVNPPTPSPTEEMWSSEDSGLVDESLLSSEPADISNDRSVVLEGLPKSASLLDVTKIIRGGRVLNLFLRRQHGTAHVAFVEPEAAERFLIYAKNNEIVIKGKAVKASWDDRQYYMLDGLARCVYQEGASRNLVIRFLKPGITEKIIRDDLEHIHTLEVIDLQLRDGHAWISLNSIKQALTARSCMLSRLRYKNHRIEFWPDECASPLIRKTTQPRAPAHTLKPTAKVFSNRFTMLHNENGESDSDCEIQV